MPADSQPTADRIYPYVSIPVTVDSTGPAPTMVFKGGTFTVDLYASDKANLATDLPVASYTFTFPSESIPVPSLVLSPLSGTSSAKNWWTFSNDGTMPGFPGRLRYVRGPTMDGSTNPMSGTSFRNEDVVRTLVPTGHSDYRLLTAAISDSLNPIDAFGPLSGAGNLVHAFVEADRADANLGVNLASNLFAPGVSYAARSRPDVPTYNANSALGDWDNGIGFVVDGAYINKPDEGNAQGLTTGKVPYFDSPNQYLGGGSLFSPNRQIPSPGMFASLPTGLKAKIPFRTLLFRPQSGHFGNNSPADHLLADLFWMPVVEPYAISEPFSTAGKINMNYAIEPFSYIRRATGMVSALRAEKLLAIPASAGLTYKNAQLLPNSNEYRLPIDAHETLAQFDSVFAAGEIFRSATEICENRLIPQGETSASVGETFWSTKYPLTGDNSRERPYTNLLGRLTTKSNTFTVHMKVQALKKSPGTPAGEWNEGKDKVVGEYRGSSTIERYISPDDTSIPDYASEFAANASAAQPDLGTFYRWRTLSTRKFAP